MARSFPSPFSGLSSSASIRLALWRQDEASGTTVSDEMGAYDLTCSTSGNIVDGLFGRGGKARDYSSASSTRTGDTTLRNTAKGEWTVQAIVRMTSTPSDSYIFAIDAAGAGSANNELCAVYVQSTGEVVTTWTDSGGATVQVTSSAQLVEDETYLVAVRKRLAASGTAGKYDVDFYIASATSFVVEYAAGVDLNNADGGGNAGVTVGDRLKASSPFTGIIDEVAFSFVALDENQIREDCRSVFFGYRISAMLGETVGVTRLVRVRVEDGDGVMRDLTTLTDAQLDFVQAVRVSSDVDQQQAQCSAQIFRAAFLNSLAPFMESSPLNINQASAYDPLIDGMRKLFVEFAIVPADYVVAGWEWISLFEGFTKRPAWDDIVTLEGADRLTALSNVVILEEETYLNQPPPTIEAHMQTLIDDNEPATGYKGYANAAPVLYVPTSPNYKINGYIQQKEDVSTALRNLAAQIGWDVKAKYDDTTGSWRPTLFEPDRTATTAQWTITADMQRAFESYELDTDSIRNKVTVIANLLDNASFDITSIDDSGSGGRVEITTSSAHGLVAGDRFAVNATTNYNGTYTVEAAPTTTTLRTVETKSGSLASESSGLIAPLDPTGAPIRQSVTVSDATSIAKYGEQAMVIAEGSTSNIDTIDEATDLANAALLDLSAPKADVSVEIPMNPFIEEGDLVELEADGVHSDVDRTFAVVGIEHNFGGGGASTKLILRGGTPIGGYERWIGMDGARPVLNFPRSSDIVVAPPTPIASNAQRAVDVRIDPASGLVDKRWDFREVRHEIHASTTSGFTPSASTLQTVARDSQVHIDGLTPHTTYYVKAVARDKNNSRSPASSQASFVPLFSGVMPAAKAYRTTSNQVMNGTEDLVELNAESFDTTSYYDTSAYRFTAPSTGLGGIYRVDARLAVDPAGKPNEKDWIKVKRFNSSGTLQETIEGPVCHNSSGASLTELHPHVSATVMLDAGDYLELYHEGVDTSFSYTLQQGAGESYWCISWVSEKP